MIQGDAVTVNLGEGQAHIDRDYGLRIEQGPYSRVGLELEDAIVLAKTVLAFAQGWVEERMDDPQQAEDVAHISRVLEVSL